MIIIKLILITCFMYFSSKALGLFIFDKLKKEPTDSINLGLGYIANLALFFLIQFPVMLFKLSTFWLMAAGIIYFIVLLYPIYISIKNKKLFHFTKKEIFALLGTFLFLLLYLLIIDFGYLETYDSYFYSVLTNSASNSKNISVVDPYTGLSNLQNYYKYISYYYQSSFFANILNISNPYLVLIWPMVFMNYFFICCTALSICRVSKNKYVNNIISLFFLTFVLTIFRAPFNAIHLVTLVLPLYIFKYMFEAVNNKSSKSVILAIICILAAISATSTTLFVMLPTIYVAYLTMTFYKKDVDYKNLFFIAIPVIILCFLYLYESIDTYYVLIMCIGLIGLIGLLIYQKWFNKFLYYLGKFLFIATPIFLIMIPMLPIEEFLKNNFMKSDAINLNEEAPDNSNIPTCLGLNNVEVKENNINHFEPEKHSTSMEYIHSKRNSKLSLIFITITHSIPKYGGMMFLFIFGCFFLRKKQGFIAFIIYLLTFFNPFVSKGVDVVTFGLSSRIALFFGTYFAILGVKYFFEWIIGVWDKHKFKIDINKILKYVIGVYIVLLLLSLGSYVSMFKKHDFKEYNNLMKVPTSLVGIDDYLNDDINKNNTTYKPRVFYTSSVFNISMIDKNPNNKSIVMNSKEYMNYYGNDSVITDKTLINDYFENFGTVDLEQFGNKCKLLKLEYDADCICNIKNMMEKYSITYVVTVTSKDEKYNKSLESIFEIVYKNNNVQILKYEKEGK